VLSALSDEAQDQLAEACRHSQRNTFYDPEHGNYWVLFVNATAGKVQARRSSDGLNWEPPIDLFGGVANASRLSTHARTDGFIYVAYRKDNSIYARKGTIGPTSIGLSEATEYTVFSGASSSDSYAYPSIRQAGGGRVWVAARYYNGTSYRVRARRSASTHSVASWENPFNTVSATTDRSWVVPQMLNLVPNGDMYVVWLHGSATGDQQIRGRKYINDDGAFESSSKLIAKTYASNEYYIPSASTNSSAPIYVAYADEDRNLKYKTLASPYTGSWPSDEEAQTLAPGIGRNVALTRDTSASGLLYAFYTTFPVTTARVKQVQVGQPNDTLSVSGEANWDQVVAPYRTDGKSHVVWRLEADSVRFSLPRIMPSTSRTTNPASPDGDNGWRVSATTVELDKSPTDSWAGVDAWYRWGDSGSYTKYTGQLTAPQGDNTLYYYSKDNVDNQEVDSQGETKQYDIKVDTATPTNPTLTSLSHTVDDTSSDNLIEVGLSGAADAVSGLDGYSIEWSQSPTTVPDTAADLAAEATSTVSPPLGYGSWYFHLRTKDVAGNWTSSAVHLGPFHIDSGLTGLEPYTTTYTESIKSTADLTVNLANGNLVTQVQGLSRPARGIPVSIHHTYNSRSSADTPFGYGWTINYARHLNIDAQNNTVTYTDEDGSEHIFRYEGGAYVTPPGLHLELIENQDGTFTLTDKAQIKSNFDAQGKLTSVVDRNDNTITLTYDDGKLIKITDASGADTTLTYSSGRLSRITTEDGRTNKYAYAGGYLTEIENAAETTSLFDYIGGYLTEVTDARINTHEITYTNDKVSSIIKPNTGYQSPPTVGFSYQAKETVVTNPRNYPTTYGWLINDKTNVSVTEPSPGGTTTYEYDADWNLTSLTRADGAKSRYNYDSRGNRLTETMPIYGQGSRNLSATSFASASVGWKVGDDGFIAKTLDGGETWISQESGTTEKLNDVQAVDSETVYAVGDNGTILKTTDGGATWTKFNDYIIEGAQIKSISMVSATAGWAVGDGGAVFKTLDGQSWTNEWVETAQWRDVHAIDADNVWVVGTDYMDGTTPRLFKRSAGGTWASASAGLAEAAYNSLFFTSGTTGWVVGDGGRIYNTIDGGSSWTQQTSGTTLDLYAIEMVSDTVGWVGGQNGRIRKTATGGQHWAGVGILGPQINGIAATDASHVRVVGDSYTTFSSADGGVTWAESPAATMYTYTASNEIATRIDALGNQTTYSYDGAGNLVEQVDPLGNSVSSGYDQYGDQISETDQLSNVTTYTYDLLGQQLTQTDTLGNVTTYSYDAAGNRTSATNALNFTETHTFDPLGYLTGHTDRLGGLTEYSYDPVGNLVQLAEHGRVTGYAYDALNRLTSETRGERSLSYTYDVAGNKTSATDALGNATSYTYDSLNRPTAETKRSGTARAFLPIRSAISPWKPMNSANRPPTPTIWPGK
jgi:YD repeat-containing protein